MCAASRPTLQGTPQRCEVLKWGTQARPRGRRVLVPSKPGTRPGQLGAQKSNATRATIGQASQVDGRLGQVKAKGSGQRRSFRLQLRSWPGRQGEKVADVGRT